MVPGTKQNDEYIQIYKASNGGLGPGDNILIPLHIEGDGRHQKCRGWNSFDGHFIAGLMGENIPIWIRSYHRPVVGKVGITRRYYLKEWDLH